MADKKRTSPPTLTALPGGQQGRNDTTIPRFMSAKQAGDYLHLNEKKVYALAAEGKIPGTKITGKWLFPRELVDQWLQESTHGGLLTDRLVVAGGDDPLIYRAIMHLANEIQNRALVSYTWTGTRLGLSLLANHRADVCCVHWGPAEESHLRHPGLLRQHPQHREWILVRICRREQGVLIARPHIGAAQEIGHWLRADLRWALRQEGAGSQRFLNEALSGERIEATALHTAATARSERDAAVMLALGRADLAPGTRATAMEFGLGFASLGWEALDFALYRNIYFRTLFQQLLEQVKNVSSQPLARDLGGYDFTECGKLIWAAD